MAKENELCACGRDVVYGSGTFGKCLQCHYEAEEDLREMELAYENGYLLDYRFPLTL